MCRNSLHGYIKRGQFEWLSFTMDSMHTLARLFQYFLVILAHLVPAGP